MTPPPITRRRFGTSGRLVPLAGTPDRLAVELEPGDLHRTGTGGDDEGAGLEPDRVSGARHLDRPRPDEAGRPLHDLDRVALLQEGDAAHHLLHDLVLELPQPGDVNRRLSGDAARGGVAQVLDQVRGGDEGLGRNAPPVDADAPQFLAVDERRLLPELCEPDRGHVASWSGPNHDRVERLRHHARLLPGRTAARQI